MDYSISKWLSDVENQEPAQPGRRRKRKAQEPADTPLQKRVARDRRPTMPRARGRGRTTGRIPLTDTTTNGPGELHQSLRQSNSDPNTEVSTAPSLDTPELPYPSSKQSNTTSTRSRSGSPRKLATLAALPYPIVYLRQDPYSEEPLPPANVQQMWARIRGYAQGRDILPQDMQQTVQQADVLDKFRDQSCFDSSGKRQELGNPPPLSCVEEIRQDTVRCKNRMTAPEDVWNDVSHVPIGQLACRCSVHASKIRWQNVKTADIAPRAALLPRAIASRPLEAARIDYAVVLEPSARLQAALPFLEPISGADDPSWAPTLMADVIHCPFASVIETKKAGGDPQKAGYQIGIWAYAMFKRLWLLLDANGRPDEPLPCLPLFIAEGETWELHIASQGHDRRTVIWDFDEIGKAVYRKGIYQIIAVQQAVLHIANTDFREWFEKHCLPQANL